MKKFLIFAALLTIPTMAQKPHAPKLVKAGAVNCPVLTTGTPHETEYCWSTPAGTTAIYEAVGACPASGIGTLIYTQVDIETALSGTYIDTAETAASTRCAYATATVSGLVSAPSNAVQFTTPVFAPTALTCTPSTTSAACTWTASIDSGTTVTVLDSAAACGTTGQTFSTVASGVAAGGPYTIGGLTGGTYCVELTATIGGVTSAASSTFQVAVTVASPAIAVQVR